MPHPLGDEFRGRHAIVARSRDRGLEHVVEEIGQAVVGDSTVCQDQADVAVRLSPHIVEEGQPQFLQYLLEGLPHLPGVVLAQPGVLSDLAPVIAALIAVDPFGDQVGCQDMGKRGLQTAQSGGMADEAHEEAENLPQLAAFRWADGDLAQQFHVLDLGRQPLLPVVGLLHHVGGCRPATLVRTLATSNHSLPRLR